MGYLQAAINGSDSMEAESSIMTHGCNVKYTGSGVQANKTAVRVPVSRCGMRAFACSSSKLARCLSNRGK